MTDTTPAPTPKNQTLTQHGIQWTDPFAHFKTPNWRDVLQDPTQLPDELRQHLDQEKHHYEAQRDTDLESTLVSELRGRMADSLAGVPLPDGDWDYHWEYPDNASYPRYLRRHQNGPWQCYFDANAQSEQHDYFDLGTLEYSSDHTRFAMTLDTQGNERYRLTLRDMQTSLAECPDECQPQLLFSADSQWVLYIWLDDENRGREIRAWHPDSGQVKVLYHELDTGFFLDLSETQDGRHGLLAAHQHQVTEIRLIDLSTLAVSDPIIHRDAGWEADLDTHGQDLILKSNHQRADFGLYQRPISGGEWQPLYVPEQGLVSDFAVLDDFLVVLESDQAQPNLRWRAWGGEWQHLTLPEPLSDLSLGNALTSDQHWQRLNWSSPRHPNELWELNLDSGSVRVLKRQHIPSGHTPDDYQCERVWVTSGEVQVPLTVVSRPGPITGVLLYGYGAYGLSLEPSFSSARLSLIDRGILHVTAHVRGGMELGYHWYKTGRDQDKPNSFDDFEAALDWCLSQHQNVVIHGGSAGGMLVGALLNRRPSDIAGMLADVPFMDVLNTMLDADLPLTPPEWPEWGNPIEDSDAFKRIQGYSPYDNLASNNYPEVLVTAGLTDPRVTFWEPMKYCARLRQVSQNPVYLRMEELGHGGASGRFGPLQEVAECYSWVLRRLGVIRNGLERPV